MDHIYIEAAKRVTIISNKIIKIKDIALLQGPKEIISELNEIVVMRIPEDSNKNYLISILDIIKAIYEKNNKLVLHNLGEKDIIISYKRKQGKDNKLIVLSKIIFVGSILFVGSAIAIMTFHTDSQLPYIFTNFYFLLLGDNKYQPYAIEIPYSIGLAVGISLFFNHFSKIKFSNDPTPIEVELKLYKNQVDDSIIEELKEEEGEK